MSAEAPSPSVQTVLGDAGASPVVEWAGRAWTIGHPVQRAKAILEEYLASEAVAEVEAMQKYATPAFYEKAFNNTLNAVRGKQFKTWGSGWKAALEGAEGSYLFLFSLLRVRQPDATVADARALLVNRPLATLAALARVCPDFFALLTADLPIPPGQQAAKAAEMAAGLLTGLTNACGLPS